MEDGKFKTKQEAREYVVRAYFPNKKKRKLKKIIQKSILNLSDAE